MSRRDGLLFYEGDLSSVLRAHVDSVPRCIDNIPEDQFLASDDDSLCEHVFSVMEIPPLDLHEDSAEMDTQEIEVDVRHDYRRAIFDASKPCLVAGIRVTVTIPFSGDAQLWKYRPSSWTTVFPRGHVRNSRQEGAGFLELVIERPSDTLSGDDLKKELDAELQNIRFYVEKVNSNVADACNNLRGRIREYVAFRRQKLAKHANVAAALNIPLKKRSGSQAVAPIPVKRRLVRPLPPAPNRPAEPSIRDEDYQHILGVIRQEGMTFETTPSTFAIHDEEGLRDIILAHLNGHYEGDATGETFRKNGKTDIRIEFQNRAAFVAECKVWRGAKEVGEAIDQLLGYVTWRDCKTALIVFNKHVAAFSDIQRDLPSTLQKHAQYQAIYDCHEHGEWCLRFRSPEDPNHLVMVRVFLFNLYCAEKKRNVVKKSKHA